MENVYITKSTYNSIVENLDFDKIDKALLGTSIFDKTQIEYLYKKQFNTILGFKYFSENPGQLSIYQKNKHDPAPKNHFLIKTSNPKFHLFKDCKSINNLFENMIIPKDIQEKGDIIVNEFRDYLSNEFGKFSANRYNDMKELIVTKINNKFKVSLGTEQISILKEDNTGLQKAVNFSLEDLESNILKFAEEYEKLCKKYPDIFPLYTLKAFLSMKPDKMTFIPINYFRSNRKDEFVKILQEFYNNIQVPTFDFLKHYYMVLFNPELKFEGHILEQLGLKACYNCTIRANQLI